MTAQVPEQLIIDGKSHSMCADPLSVYVDLGGKMPDLDYGISTLWRGYRGTWEIINRGLYLIDLMGFIRKGGDLKLGDVFPGVDRVFAHWFSGVVRSPRGELLKYEHIGYASEYEWDYFYEFEKGILINTINRSNNAKGDPLIGVLY